MSIFKLRYTDLPAGRLLTDALYVGRIALAIQQNEVTTSDMHGLPRRLGVNEDLCSRMGLSRHDQSLLSLHHSQSGGPTETHEQMMKTGMAITTGIALAPRILPLMSHLIDETAGLLKTAGKASEAFWSEYPAGVLQYETSWRKIFLLSGQPDPAYRPDSYSPSTQEYALRVGHDLVAESRQLQHPALAAVLKTLRNAPRAG